MLDENIVLVLGEMRRKGKAKRRRWSE